MGRDYLGKGQATLAGVFHLVKSGCNRTASFLNIESYYSTTFNSKKPPRREESYLARSVRGGTLNDQLRTPTNMSYVELGVNVDT